MDYVKQIYATKIKLIISITDEVDDWTVFSYFP